jgi:ATP-dependent phosphofructokinase / diphosphate-dependent phosphofructokinase
VMGRHAGWIAFHAGLAGGANVILIPERQFDIDAVCELVGRRFASQFAPIIVVAEGAEPKGGMPDGTKAPHDAFGHVRLGGVGHWLEGEIERRTGKETRATVLGHVQRGGTPTAFDRFLATRFGLHAIDAAEAGSWGTMTALRGTEIELVQLTEATAELKTVPASLYEEAEVFFG